MNYIKQLQDDNLKLKQALSMAIQGMWNLEQYAHSEKYSVDPNVNKNDISLRLNETLAAVSRLESRSFEKIDETELDRVLTELG